jgi:hypothetical protein
MLEQDDNAAAIRATQEALASISGTEQSQSESILRFYSIIARTEFGEPTNHATDLLVHWPDTHSPMHVATSVDLDDPPPVSAF